MVEDVQQALQPPLEIEPISDREFALFQRLIYRLAGINMADSKKPLVAGRLSRRLRHYGLDSFGASAPADKLYQHFGITTEAVVAAARAQLAH